MRHPDREVRDRAELDLMIRQASVCRLGLCKDNHPYVVPVSFGYDGSFIYFHTGREGMKVDYMKANDRVCFELEHDVQLLPGKDRACQWSFSFLSVIGFGRVREITATADKVVALNRIMEQYGDKGDHFDIVTVENKTRVWCIAIETLTGKRSKDRIVNRP